MSPDNIRKIAASGSLTAMRNALLNLARDMDHRALFRGRAQDEEPRVRHTCNMGVGCEEAGVCYAAAHGEPDRCGMPNDKDA